MIDGLSPWAPTEHVERASEQTRSANAAAVKAFREAQAERAAAEVQRLSLPFPSDDEVRRFFRRLSPHGIGNVLGCYQVVREREERHEENLRQRQAQWDREHGQQAA